MFSPQILMLKSRIKFFTNLSSDFKVLLNVVDGTQQKIPVPRKVSLYPDVIQMQ